MPDITLEFVPWPIGTNVGVYPRRSELMLADQPPPMVTQLDSAAVAANQSVTFDGLPDAEAEYWAIAPIDGLYRYLAFNTPDPIANHLTMLDAQVADLDARQDVSEGHLTTLDGQVAANTGNITANTNSIAANAAAITAGDVALANALGLNAQTGVVAPSDRGWTAQNMALGTARSYFQRFVAPRNMTVVKIAFVVEVAAASDIGVDVGIYQQTVASPARLTKVVTSGQVLGKLNAGTGRKEVPIAATNLVAGQAYFAAFATPAAGAASIAGVSASTTGGVHSLYAPLADVYWINGFPLAGPTVDPSVGGNVQAALAVAES